MNLKFFKKQCGTHISCVQNRLFISSECPFHTLASDLVIFKYTSLYYFFMATKVNRSTKSDFFLQISKITSFFRSDPLPRSSAGN